MHLTEVQQGRLSRAVAACTELSHQNFTLTRFKSLAYAALLSTAAKLTLIAEPLIRRETSGALRKAT